MAWLYSRQAAKQSQTNKSKIKGFSPTQISWFTSIRIIYGHHKSSTGWWYTYPSENDGVQSQLTGKIKAMFQSTKQYNNPLIIHWIDDH
jgi:hypothetical protein